MTTTIYDIDEHGDFKAIHPTSGPRLDWLFAHPWLLTVVSLAWGATLLLLGIQLAGVDLRTNVDAFVHVVALALTAIFGQACLAHVVKRKLRGLVAQAARAEQWRDIADRRLQRCQIGVEGAAADLGELVTGIGQLAAEISVMRAQMVELTQAVKAAGVDRETMEAVRKLHLRLVPPPQDAR